MKKSLLSRRRFLYGLGAAFGALVVAGCGETGSDTPGAETVAQPPLPGGSGSETPSPTLAATQDESPAPGEPAPTTAAEPSPTVELTFHPTDPASVQLAAGRPQFVEFFAFW